MLIFEGKQLREGEWKRERKGEGEYMSVFKKTLTRLENILSGIFLLLYALANWDFLI